MCTRETCGPSQADRWLAGLRAGRANAFHDGGGVTRDPAVGRVRVPSSSISSSLFEKRRWAAAGVDVSPSGPGAMVNRDSGR